ncbi:MAG: AraC family transcriptional regulator ligand-binding domain-containing protein [Roseobacter sp.]
MSRSELVPVFWLSHLVKHFGETAPQVTAALDEIGLNLDRLADAELKLEQHHEAQFLHSMAQRMPNGVVGAEAGLCLDIRQTTLLSYVAFNSQTLDHALQNLVRFLPLMRPSSHVTMTPTADVTLVQFDNHNKAISVNTQYMEFSVAMLINALRRASERDIAPISVSFRHDRAQDKEKIRRLFACPVTFSETDTIIALRPSDLSRPIVHRDPNLYREVFQYGRLLLDSTRPDPASLEDQVRDYIAQHMTRTPPSMEGTAEALGLSPRTLARRLARVNTTYRALRDTLRLSAAQEMLSDTDTSLAEMTYLLGYSDQSAFGVAFKRATGQTPNQYRRSFRSVTSQA